MNTTNKTTADLATITTTLLQDTEANPSAVLQDVACAIAEQFPIALASFVARLQAAGDESTKNSSLGVGWTKYEVDATFKGRRFVRITRTVDHGAGQRSVCVFVEKGTGLIYKAASFKKPTENFTRGCIFNLGSMLQNADGSPTRGVMAF